MEFKDNRFLRMGIARKNMRLGLYIKKKNTCKLLIYRCLCSHDVRAEGLEPPCREAPDPKSGMSTNSTTPALMIQRQRYEYISIAG